MTRVYIIGPFRGANHWRIAQNIHRAAEVALSLWQMGFAVFCPHLNSSPFQGAAPDENFLEGDLAWLLCSHAAVVLPGYEYSSGSLAEIKAAEKAQIPVHYWPDRPLTRNAV